MAEYRMEVLVEQLELKFGIKSMHVDYQREPEFWVFWQILDPRGMQINESILSSQRVFGRL